MWTFVSPRVIAFGEDALEALRSEKAEKVLIVADESMLKLGYVDKVREVLTASKVEIFSEVEPEPSMETALKCTKLARELQPELIVAVGGGSVIDVAKAVRILMEIDVDPLMINPFTDLYELGFKKKAKLVAIPTTSGTGADVTWASVLTDKAENRKLTPSNKEVVPDVSILDYRFVEAMPKRLIAGSGMDALAHAVEGILAPWKNEFSDAMCEKAIELILNNLERSYNGDLEARAKMHLAATMAGLGFGNSQVGLVHSLGHTFGAVFKLHHGMAVGLFLPYVLCYYLKSDAKARLDEIAMKNKLSSAEKFIDRIFELMRNIEIPTRLSEVISEKDFKNNLETLILNTLNDTSLGTSPRIPDYNETQKIYEYAFEGKRIDF